MRSMRLVLIAALLALPFAVKAPAQVAVGVGIGPAIVAPPVAYGPPVCDWGYYNYYPSACAPYGYYGPEWFSDGLFIGVGPWYHWGWGRGGWGRGGYGYRGGYGRAGYGYAGRGAYGGAVRGGYAAAPRAYAGGGARSFSGGHASFSGGGFHGGGGGGFHGGGGGHGGGGHR